MSEWRTGKVRPVPLFWYGYSVEYPVVSVLTCSLTASTVDVVDGVSVSLYSLTSRQWLRRCSAWLQLDRAMAALRKLCRRNHPVSLFVFYKATVRYNCPATE